MSWKQRIDTARRGLLIVNLGSPQSPEPADIAAFLRRFLSDRRVVNLPRVIWLPLLHGVIARRRPREIQHNYRAIWWPEGSPLTVITRRQAALLRDSLPGVRVEYAMTYAEPTIAQRLVEFEQAGITDLTVIAMYPQYAVSTAAGISDQIFDHYRRARQVPNLRIINRYGEHPIYLDWHARALRARIDAAPVRFDRIVFSFHGLPVHPDHDPADYTAQCEATMAAIMAHPALAEVGIAPELCFQSKFGRGAWLQPATIDRLAALPQLGVGSVLVCTPGFLADCIETLDEIAVLNRQAFTCAGGEHFEYLNPMNDDPAIVALLTALFDRQ